MSSCISLTNSPFKCEWLLTERDQVSRVRSDFSFCFWLCVFLAGGGGGG